MRKAAAWKPPYRDGRFTRQSLQRAAMDGNAKPFDTTGMTRVRLPATAAQGAGKMAPRTPRMAGQHRVQTVGVASEHTKYSLPVRTTQDTPDVHPMDRPKKKPARKQEKGDPDVHLD